jgi:predicted permease
MSLFSRLAVGIVRAAAWLAPRHSRESWLEEWLGEIDAGTDARVALRRAVGAPRDALSLRALRRTRSGDRRLRWPLSRSDALFAVRVMRRTPIVTAASVLALAVGLALTVVAYGLVRGVFYLPLPGANGGRIVRMSDYDPTERVGVDMTLTEFSRRRAMLRAFTDVGGFDERTLRWGEGTRARLVTVAYVTTDAMSILGVRPVAGRDLRGEDARTQIAEAMLVREPLAIEAFGSVSAALGQRIEIDGVRRTVVGVMPAECRFPFISDVWLPFVERATAASAPEQSVRLFGRLASGVTIEQAAADFTLARASGPPRLDRDRLVSLVTPFGRPPGPPEQQYIAWAFVAALLLLLGVATANVALLVLARAAARRDELVVRTALGASRLRLIAQLGCEGAGVGVVAAVLGTAAAAMALRWLSAVIPDLPYWVHFDFDRRAAAVMAALAVMVSAGVGVLPALRLTRRHAAINVTRTASAVRFGRASSVLIAIEVAVAVGLLCGAATLGRALFRFGAQELGLPARDVVVAELYYGAPPDTRESSYESWPPERRREIWREWEAAAGRQQQELQSALASFPGVTLVARASALPGNQPEAASFEIDDEAAPRTIATRIVATDDRFFAVLDAPPVIGRPFTQIEIERGSPVAIVNRLFVARHLGNGAAIGRRLRRIEADGARGPWLEIVGVVGDLGLNPGAPSLADGVYVPLRPSNLVRLAIRTTDQGGLVPRIHELAAQGAPQASVQWTSTLAEQLNEPVLLYRGFGYALTALGLVALLLACTGIHALVSLSVSERKRELAVRLALGAGHGRLAREVLARAASQLVTGCLAGALIAYGVHRAVMLTPFDLDTSGPWTVAAAAALLLAAGFGACAKPLARALAFRAVDLK